PGAELLGHPDDLLLIAVHRAAARGSIFPGSGEFHLFPALYITRPRPETVRCPPPNGHHRSGSEESRQPTAHPAVLLSVGRGIRPQFLRVPVPASDLGRPRRNLDRQGAHDRPRWLRGYASAL